MEIKVTQYTAGSKIVFSTTFEYFATINLIDGTWAVDIYDSKILDARWQIRIEGTADEFRLTDNARFIFYLKQIDQEKVIVKKNIQSGEEEEVYKGTIKNYKISSAGNFVSMQTSQVKYLLIKVLTKEVIVHNDPINETSFSNDEKHFYMLLYRQLIKIDLNNDKEPEELTLPDNLSGCSHFIVHSNERLVLLQTNNWFYIYDIKTKKPFHRVVENLSDIKFISFIGQERLLLVTEKHLIQMENKNPSSYLITLISESLKAKEKFEYEVFIYDLGDRRSPQKIVLDKFEKIVVDFTGTKVAVAAGNELKCIQIIHRKEQRHTWQVINNQNKEISIKGIKLVQIAHEAVQKILTTVNHGKSYQAKKDTFYLKNAQDWLATAGHLSCYATGIDVRFNYKENPNDKWYPAHFVIGESNSAPVKVDGKQDAYVCFPMCENGKGDYVSISSYLANLTSTAPPTLEEFIKIINGEYMPLQNTKHQEIALALLQRINGNNYSDNFTPDQKKFLDTLLVLILGIEASRNNATFLTAIMLFDLIASCSTFGRMNRAYSWDNAFVSGPGYDWDDAEQKDCGGKFPMATNSTGSGNMKDRREAIKGGQVAEEIFLDSQRHRVPEREMSLIINWLKQVFRKDPTLFKKCNTEEDLLKIISDFFYKRLERAYFSQEPYVDYLTHNTTGFVYSKKALSRHYKDEPYVFYLKHQSSDGKVIIDKYYHRTDHPCKTMPGYVTKEDPSKTLTYPEKHTIHSKANIKRKYRLKFLRIYISDLTKKIQESSIDHVVKGKYLNIFNDYRQWQLDYFNPKLLSDVHTTIDYKNISTRTITEAVLNELKWEKGEHENERKITAEQIKRIIRNNENFKKQSLSFSPNELTELLNDYSDQLLKYLQQACDPIIDNYHPKAVTLDLYEGTYFDRVAKLNELAEKHELGKELKANEEFLIKLLRHSGFSNFTMDFRLFAEGKKLSPCPSCHSEHSEPYPALPYDHTKNVCLSHKDSKLYHRVDSGCENIFYSEDKFSIYSSSDKNIKPVEAEASFVLAEQQKGKKPCECCWWPLVVDIPNYKDTEKFNDTNNKLPNDTCSQQVGTDFPYEVSSAPQATSLNLYQELLTITSNWNERVQLQQALDQSIQETLQQEAQKRNFTCRNVPGDGNCFFHVIADQLRYIHTEKIADLSNLQNLNHAELRKRAVTHIFENQAEYQNFIDETDAHNFDAFIEKLKQGGTWADHVIISALAKALNINLEIIRSDAAKPIIIEQDNPRATLYLGYIVDLHYKSLHRIPETHLASSAKFFNSAPATTTHPTASAAKRRKLPECENLDTMANSDTDLVDLKQDEIQMYYAKALSKADATTKPLEVVLSVDEMDIDDDDMLEDDEILSDNNDEDLESALSNQNFPRFS